MTPTWLSTSWTLWGCLALQCCSGGNFMPFEPNFFITIPCVKYKTLGITVQFQFQLQKSKYHYHLDAIFRDHSSESGKWLVWPDGLRCLGGKVTVKLKQSFDALMSPITLHLWENKIYKQLLEWKCQNAQSWRQKICWKSPITRRTFNIPSWHKATGSSTLVYTSAQFPTIFAPIYTSKYNFKILTSDIKFFTLKISQFTFTDVLYFSLCLVK